MTTTDEQMEQMLDQLSMLADIWIGEDKDPTAIAAAMSVISMKLYRTSLSEEDYDAMIDEISERREDITPFESIR
jgi:hypothetical protein